MAVVSFQPAIHAPAHGSDRSRLGSVANVATGRRELGQTIAMEQIDGEGLTDRPVGLIREQTAPGREDLEGGKAPSVLQAHGFQA